MFTRPDFKIMNSDKRTGTEAVINAKADSFFYEISSGFFHVIADNGSIKKILRS